jgi:rhodanese-related sulfurtransferase
LQTALFVFEHFPGIHSAIKLAVSVALDLSSRVHANERQIASASSSGMGPANNVFPATAKGLVVVHCAATQRSQIAVAKQNQLLRKNSQERTRIILLAAK